MSNKYSPMPPKVETDRYAYYELQDLARAISEPQPELQLQVLYRAPTKPREGMVVEADGTSWNPGSGAGPYAYIGGSWTALAGGGGPGGNVATDSIWDAKGDLAVGTGANTAAKLTVGVNGYVLTADSTQATGLKWAAAAAGGGSLDDILALQALL